MQTLFIKHWENQRECLFNKWEEDIISLGIDPKVTPTKVLSLMPVEVDRIKNALTSEVQQVLSRHI